MRTAPCADVTHPNEQAPRGRARSCLEPGLRSNEPFSYTILSSRGTPSSVRALGRPSPARGLTRNLLAHDLKPP